MVGETPAAALVAEIRRVPGCRWRCGAGATGAGGIAAGHGRPRRVKEQVFRTRHGADLLPDISWRAHLLLLGVLPPGTGLSSQVAGTPAGRHRFPVRRDFLSPKRMPPGIHLQILYYLNTLFPRNCRPCRSRLWATSCAPAIARVLLCRHLPVWRLRITRISGRRKG